MFVHLVRLIFGPFILLSFGSWSWLCWNAKIFPRQIFAYEIPQIFLCRNQIISIFAWMNFNKLIFVVVAHISHCFLIFLVFSYLFRLAQVSNGRHTISAYFCVHDVQAFIVQWALIYPKWSIWKWTAGRTVKSNEWRKLATIKHVSNTNNAYQPVIDDQPNSIHRKYKEKNNKRQK